MNFNKHSDLVGQHALLSPSKYHWLNYDDEKLDAYHDKQMATERGTRLHAFACECILLGQKLPKSKKSLNCFVNDAIGYRMTPELTLFYSYICFGTADALSFRQNLLRIHDLKTGVTPASMKQLEVYAALFCLEYNYKPSQIGIELRLYQTENVIIHEPPVDDIFDKMERIVACDKRIQNRIRGE